MDVFLLAFCGEVIDGIIVNVIKNFSLTILSQLNKNTKTSVNKNLNPRLK